MDPIKELKKIAAEIEDPEVSMTFYDASYWADLKDSFEEWADNYEMGTTADYVALWLTTDTIGQGYLNKLVQKKTKNK